MRLFNNKPHFYFLLAFHGFVSGVLAINLIWFSDSDLYLRFQEISESLIFIVHWGVLFLLGIPLIVIYAMYDEEKHSVYKLDPEDDHRLEIVSVLAEVLREKDPQIEGHSERVADIARKFCAHLDLSASESRVIIFAALFHDIGKLFLDPSLFYGDRANMTVQEKQAYHYHAVYGQKILEKVSSYPGAGMIVRHHHERWTGTGYPDSLAGEDIPVGSRIIAVADAYDAIVNGLNSLRRNHAPGEALAVIQQDKNSKFDPSMVNLLERMVSGHEV